MSETSLFPDLLGRENWAMLPGERTVLEGLLAALQPTLSVEIGTDKGGSLERICAHSVTVHAFDLIRLEEITSDRFPNLVFHEGDSHELLPGVLAGLAVVAAKQRTIGIQENLDHLGILQRPIGAEALVARRP
jgi:cephalosporin hydroxylase